jgi:hypothetical protein
VGYRVTPLWGWFVQRLNGMLRLFLQPLQVCPDVARMLFGQTDLGGDLAPVVALVSHLLHGGADRLGAGDVGRLSF